MIDTYPTFPIGSPGVLTSGNNATLWAAQHNNSFTVTNGSITAANFLVATTDGNALCLNSGESFPNVLCVNDVTSGANSLTLTTAATHTGNLGGFSGATYTPVSSVPFEFNENLAVLTFLGVVGIGKLMGKLKNKPKDN